MSSDRLKYRIRAALTRAALALVRWLHRDSNYISHLHREVPGWFKEEDSPNRWIADGTADLLAVLASQGHSGTSASFAVQFFSKIALFEPWGPLTGEDHEWAEPYNSEGTRQNLRCSRVFREKDGTAYDIHGKVFLDSNGVGYTSQASRVPVTFPYTPKTEYVDVAETEDD